ncbi:MAG: C4-dicarboxylate ABC transporter substrate-binding protein, partial [Actinomycetospora chiangmaiensis]|nr:C4-dicarboxylate ABC transporter substrate-binding protein [Actinomycetospora chiangmaiensis]
DDGTAYRLVRAIARADLGATAPKNLVGVVPETAINPATLRFLRDGGADPH